MLRSVKVHRGVRIFAAGLFVAGLFVAGPGVAQDSGAQAPAGATAQEEQKPVVEEEITVTARKREESLQEVPFSMLAPDEETLRQRGATDLEGVAANSPGLIVQNLGPGQSQVAMRGVSSGQIVRDQPGVKEQVGAYLDESAISLSLFTPDIDLFDMSRVEVLRGPQGTLFGAGSLSGTIRYISNQPEIGVATSVAEVGLSSIDGGDIGYSAKAAFNVPLGETTAMRVTAWYNDLAGWVDAIQPDLSVHEDVNSGSRAGVRWALRFEPNEDLVVTPRIVYQEVETDGWNRQDVFNILANPYTTTRPRVTFGETEQFTQFEEPFSDEFLLADLNIQYDLGGMDLTSITSYTDRDVLVVRDATALTASITGGSIGLPENVYTLDAPLFDATQAKMWTQELRLAGDSERFDWVAGLFYSQMERDYGQDLPVFGFEDLTGIPTAGRFGAGKDHLYFSDLHYELDQYALFGEGTWAVNDRLGLTGGLRYYDFSEDRTQVFDGIFADPASRPGGVDADGVAPRLIASYAVNEGTNLNAQVSKGFRLGGVNDQLNVPLCTPADLAAYSGNDTWDDEVAWNYEVGSKTTLAGGGIFNAAVFYMDISDLQATVTAGSCSSRLILNVPKARSQGVELSFAKTLGTSFDVDLSASYTDSELRSTLRDTSGNVLAGIQAGNRLPTVPELQGVAAGTWRWTAGSWLGTVTGVYQHVGSRFTQIGDQAAGFGVVVLDGFAGDIGGPYTQPTHNFDAELPAYDIFNLRVGFANEKWDLAAYVNNVTDEVALLALDQERGTRARQGYLINQSRTFGITARVKLY